MKLHTAENELDHVATTKMTSDYNKGRVQPPPTGHDAEIVGHHPKRPEASIGRISVYRRKQLQQCSVNNPSQERRNSAGTHRESTSTTNVLSISLFGSSAPKREMPHCQAIYAYLCVRSPWTQDGCVFGGCCYPHSDVGGERRNNKLRCVHCSLPLQAEPPAPAAATPRTTTTEPRAPETPHTRCPRRLCL